MLRVLLIAAFGAAAIGGAGGARAALPETSAALRSLVQSGRHSDLRWPTFPLFRSEVGRLYERAAWEPLWIRDTGPTAAATQLIARLAAADTLGLDPADYDPVWLDRQAHDLLAHGGTPTAEALARFDVGLSVAAVRFVSALHRGRLSPSEVHAHLFIPHSSLAVEMAVDSLRDAGQQGAILERVQPRLHHYQLLKNGLARYRAMERDTSLAALRGVPRALKPGMRFNAAPQLRHLLDATGDLDRAGHSRTRGESIYSADLVAGVRQIELALERFRWLPVAFAQPPIIVNIPAFRLYAFRGKTDSEDEMLSMNVVVGAAFEKSTPVFAAEMKYMIFRPYWEVPASIMKDELGPKALSNAKFLEHERLVLVSGEADSAPELPATPANLKRIGTDVRIRQLPGPENALGLVKFLLPNAHDVYLHDTAAKGLFASARRDFSHGCIRLSDPAALAAHVLRDQPEWTTERIRDAMAGDDNVRVNLTQHVPVYIIYPTAIASDSDDVYFYSDIYHLDEELDQLLRKGYPYPK